MEHKPVSRRNIVKGAAWAVPAVTVATAVPAFAASPQTSPTATITSGNVANFRANSHVDRTLNTSTYRIYNNTDCSFTFDSGSTVSSVTIVYWLPYSNLTFTPQTSSTTTNWVGFTYASPEFEIVTSGNGINYYPYKITYAGPTTSSCGPTYSFYARNESGTTLPELNGYYYQIRGNVNGTLVIRPFQTISNP